MKKFLIILVLIGIILLLWVRFIGTKGLEVKEYLVVNQKIPSNFAGLKIVQLSDIHYGSTIFEKELQNIVEKINEYKADIVVFTGDLIEPSYKYTKDELDKIADILGSIQARIGKYAINGNHDYECDEFDNILYKSNFTLLHNKTEKVFFEGTTPILISGVTSMLHSNPDYEDLFKDIDENSYHILLAHEPDVFLKLKNYNIDLMLSGHSHGGQVRLPYIGTLVTVNGAKTYYEEHYKVNKTDLYISSGLGTSTFKLRFFNKPSINIYRLDNK